MSLLEVGPFADAPLGEIIEDLPDDVLDLPIEEVPALEAAADDDDGLLEVRDFLAENRSLGELTNLNALSLNDLSEIGDVPIGEISEVLSAFAGEIPGLADIPFSQFPEAPNLNSARIGRADRIWGDTSERQAVDAISGPNCSGSCPNIELQAPGNVAFLGRWVVIRDGSGAITQVVPGGNGALQSVGGGTEPVGRFPFGDRIKAIVREVDVESDTFEFGFALRICRRFLGCTPYTLPTKSGIPLFVLPRDSFLLLGNN